MMMKYGTKLKRLLKPRTLPKHLLWAEIGLLAGALLLVVALVIVLTGKSAPSTATQKAPAPIAVVEITPDGFVPTTISITKGTKVVWVNQDVMPHLIAADPYPTHKQLPALLAPKALGNKQTYSFTFTKAKTVNYHDELNPTAAWEGVVVVK
jgi:plastocyanin